MESLRLAGTYRYHICLCFVLTISSTALSQDKISVNSNTAITTNIDVPAKLIRESNKKSAYVEKSVVRKTTKYIRHLQKMEIRLYKQLYKIDSANAKNLFANDPHQQYASILNKMDTVTGGSGKFTGVYHPYVDSLQGMLGFLKKNPVANGLSQEDISKSLKQLGVMQDKLQYADQTSEFIRQRKDLIKQYLSQYTHIPSGIKDTYEKYNRDLYYYNTQIKEYKDMLDNPDKALKAALTAFNKVPAFKSFMQQNSLLAGIFGSTATPGAIPSIEGLATRDQIQSIIGGQIAGGGTDASSVLSRNIRSARQELDRLQDKILVNGQGNNGADLPDNFRVNTHKGKSFLKRLEYDCNIQHAPATSLLPATSSIGLSAGYKLRDNISTGIGIAYQLGLGKDIDHFQLSNQGVGLRSYVNIKAKRSIWITACFEENYIHRFYGIQSLRRLNLWQESALVGLTKKFNLGKKENNIQLLYDLLVSKQHPRTQPLKFRVGYKL